MAMAVSCQGSSRPSTCPPWLQAALAEIEQKVQSLTLSLPEDPTSDSFAERAENYYQKRPQLLALIRDLHNRYLYLADRYSQSLIKLGRSSAPHSELSDDDYDRPPLSSITTFSDPDGADSSLSFHFPHHIHFLSSSSVDPIIVELTISMVESHILLDQLSYSGRRQCDSSRKIELQKSLLELMESERMVLVAENATLEFRAASAEEEGRGLAVEVGYLRRKAGELAKFLTRMRDDHRVCVLGRRIEGLRNQVRGMERREREWRELMARREREKVEVREEMEKLREENRRLRNGRKKAGRWWGWVGKHGERGSQGRCGCLWDNPCFCL